MKQNKIQLIGRVGQDPEVKSTANGGRYAKFSVATSESYQKNGEWVEETEWHQVEVWGDRAERLARVKKGSLVYVEGSLKSYEYEGKRFWKVKAYKILSAQTEQQPKPADPFLGPEPVQSQWGNPPKPASTWGDPIPF